MNVMIHPYLKYQLNKISRLTLLGSTILMLAILLGTYHAYIQKARLMSAHQALVSITLENKKQAKTFLKKVNHQATSTRFLEKHAFIMLLESIQYAADQNKIAYSAIAYKSIHMPEINVMSYQINYPFTATYLDLKKFLYAVLEPYKSTIVLSHIALYRESNQTDSIDGELQFTLYFRD